jgi:Putative metallopeptidase family (DUF6782)
MAKTKRGLSEAERAERRARDRERLQHAARELLTSDGWQRWVRARALFHNYSLRNCLLLAAQCHERGIDARRVAGFRTWLKLVDPAPIEPPCEPLSGDSHRHLLERLQAFAREIDFAVALEPISGGAGGWCDPKRRRIVVDAGLPANAQVRVLVHELAHALGVGYEQFGRARAEVIVDTVTFVVCRAVGLRVDGESVPYVAGWGEDGALDAVLEFAETIDAVARRLEDVLIDPAEAEEQGAAA